LSIVELVNIATKKGLSMAEVMAMPELNEYRYSQGEAWICSALVTMILQQGGIFGDLELNPHEFTPKDVFMLNIYEENPDLPEQCKINNPGMPFCQILGNFVIEKDWKNREYNSISPYSRMNERCSSQSPSFFRNDGC